MLLAGAGAALALAACVPIKQSPPPAGLRIAPAQHEFPDTDAGQSSAKTFTVTNDGGSVSGPLAVAVQGGNAAGDYETQNDGCAARRLGPGEKCTVDAVFKALNDNNPRTTSLVVSGAPGGTVTAALSGRTIE